MGIEGLLEQIEDILEESKTTLGGTKIKVDGDEIRRVIADIRTQMPEEFMQARKIANERKIILEDAQAKYDKKIAEANDEAARLVEETEITKMAKQGAAEIISQAKSRSDEIISKAKADAQVITENAEKWSRDIRANASDFVDEIMNDCDEIMSSGVDEMSKCIKNIRAARDQIKRAVSKRQ